MKTKLFAYDPDLIIKIKEHIFLLNSLLEKACESGFQVEVKVEESNSHLYIKLPSPKISIKLLKDFVKISDETKEGWVGNRIECFTKCHRDEE